MSLLFAASVTLAVFAIFYTPGSKGKFSESNNTVAHIFIACAFITSMTIMVQHFLYGDLVRSIRREMEFVEATILEHLQMPICFRKIRNLFFIKIGLMTGAYLQSIAVYFVGMYVFEKTTICPLAYGLAIIADIACMYAILCVDLVHKVLVEINVILKHYDQKLRANRKLFTGQFELPLELSPQRTVEKIEVLKQMYLSAWILTRKINDSFGWFFVAYLIQQFIDLAADLFWLFLINHDDFSYKIVCKYNKYLV